MAKWPIMLKINCSINCAAKIKKIYILIVIIHTLLGTIYFILKSDIDWQESKLPSAQRKNSYFKCGQTQ